MNDDSYRKSWRLASAMSLGLVLSCAAATVPALARTAGSGPASHTLAFSGSDLLLSVSAAGESDAWAVGSYFVNHTSKELPLIEQWNGRKWRLSPSPAVGGSRGGYLLGVTAISAKDAWAVGGEGTGRALIEHWNGRRWIVVKGAPVRGKSTQTSLASIAASSAKSIWAAGTIYTARGIAPLMEHWNGIKWSRVSTPDPGGPAADDVLTGVAASNRGTWAVGSSAPGDIYQTLALAFLGGKWRRVTSPDPSGLGNWLGAVSAAGSHVLAAGFGGYDNPAAAFPLVARWTGHALGLQHTPDPGGLAAQDELYGVAETSSGGWTVGRSKAQTLVLRQRAGHWRRVPSPSWPSPATSILEGAAAWRSTAWAVGQYSVIVKSGAAEISVSYSLILRWNGTKWVKMPSPNR